MARLYIHSFFMMLLFGGASVSADADDSSKSNLNIEYQAVNSYLSSFESLRPIRKDFEPVLADAITIIDSIGVENFKKENVDEKYITLTENAQVVSTIIRDLLVASNSCSKNNLDFLVIVLDKQTFKHQALNQYASNLIKDCWLEYLNRYNRQILVAFGKLKSPLVETLTKVVIKYKKTLDSESQIQSIKIYDTETRLSNKEIVHLLTDLHINSANEGVLAKAINRIYRDQLEERVELTGARPNHSEKVTAIVDFYENFILNPCTDLTNATKMLRDRAQFDYEKYVNSSLSTELAERKKHDDELWKVLEVERICRSILGSKNSIRTMIIKYLK